MFIDILLHMPSVPCCTDKKERATIARTAAFLKVIGDENRLRILCMLQEGERCVCDIWRELDLPQNLASHHLKVLKEYGLIRSRKNGLKVFYSIHQKAISLHSISLTHTLWRTHKP